MFLSVTFVYRRPVDVLRDIKDGIKILCFKVTSTLYVFQFFPVVEWIWFVWLPYRSHTQKVYNSSVN